MNISEGGSNSQDFDLNLAPIIDCFTVLITYLLVSASFLNLSILDVGVAANGEAVPQEQQATENPINMEVLVAVAQSATIKITGGAENLDLSIPVGSTAAGGLDLETLAARINEAKEKYPTLQELSVTAEAGVKYKQLIQVIENLKKSVPKIFISG